MGLALQSGLVGVLGANRLPDALEVGLVVQKVAVDLRSSALVLRQVLGSVAEAGRSAPLVSGVGLAVGGSLLLAKRVLGVDVAEQERLYDQGLALLDLSTNSGWLDYLEDRALLGLNLRNPLCLLDQEPGVVDDRVTELVEADLLHCGWVIVSVYVQKSVLS